jgi:hypothetical protein
MGKLKQAMLSKEEKKEYYTLYDIALVKSYTYCENYDPHSGRVTEKTGANYLKEGFIDGFLAGFAHKITGD